MYNRKNRYQQQNKKTPDQKFCLMGDGVAQEIDG